MDAEDEEANSHWTSMENTSLFQQSQLDLLNESSVSGLETQNYGLDDLSCSLIHCNGDGDGDGTRFPDLIDVERFCDEIMKRDSVISSLYNTLTVFVKHREDGDNILASVEKQVGFLNRELSKCQSIKFPIDGSGDAVVEVDIENRTWSPTLNNHSSLLSGKNAEIQTDPDPSFRPNSIDVSVQCQDQSPEYQKTRKCVKKNDSSSIAAVVSVSPVHQVARYNQVELYEDEVMRNQSEPIDDNLDDNESPHGLSYPPNNPDALRLTFSPSICEYEAEAHSGNKSNEHRSVIIEDLKLQISDSERKLEATKKYLEEMTTERELERDEFQRTINELVVRCEEIRKDKEKAEHRILQQKLEMDDIIENLQESNKMREELISKSSSSQDELTHAVEKICELREIIRTLEEQVEEATRHATMLTESKKGLADDSIAEECSRDTFNEHRRNVDDGCTSELDYAEELQVQVQDLAKRIEEKLAELENFPWSTRPGSSCSIKSGDDVSVRAAARIQRNENDSLAQDFVSRVSCGLRRLESSFDSLVRFEGVLLKKINDAELKISIENRRQEELNAENCMLRKELMVCRQKMMDFESFIQESKKPNSIVLTPSIEAIRTSARGPFQRFEDSSPVTRHHNMAKGQLEQDERADQDSEEYGLDESSNKGRSPRNSNKPQDEGALEKEENELPVEYGNEEFYQESFDEQMNDDYNTISPSSGGRHSGGPEKTKGRLMSNDDSSDTPFNGLVIETDLDLGNRGGSSPELNKSNSRSRSRSAGTSRRATEGSGPSKIPGPSRRSADDSEAGTDRTRSSDGFRPGDVLDEGGNRSWESNNEDENADGDEAADVVTYDVTTVSDYEVYGDNVKYMGSKILPTDDPNPDDQNSRLEGTDAVVEMEKLKTQLDQLQRALEAEKQRSQELANQLNEIFQDAPHNMPGDSQAGRSSRFGPGEESRMEEQIRELEHTLQEKNRSECKYKRNLDCVYSALGQLQDENQQLRSYVQELENDLQYYSSQVQP